MRHAAWCAGVSSRRVASRIAARSTTAGTPVKSCNSTRAGMYGTSCTREGGHEIAACALLMIDPMPEWTVDEILAVHFRMHKAEGVLFRDALARAAGACGLRFVGIHEKRLDELAQRALGTSLNAWKQAIASLGKSVGPPWGKDQKDASLAAMIALQGRGT